MGPDYQESSTGSPSSGYREPATDSRFGYHRTTVSDIAVDDLRRWCAIPGDRIAGHPDAKVPIEILESSARLAEAMARELAETVKQANAAGRDARAIVPCGPTSWFAQWVRIVNAEGISLRRFHVFHMDECLDWQGRELPAAHPSNFRTTMEREFYGGIRPELTVPEPQRYWLGPATMESVRRAIDAAPIDLTLGGFGQDGHIAYNQAPRHPYVGLTAEDVAGSTIRMQEMTPDTTLSIALRTFGGGHQFAPAMNVTLGMRECLMAKKIRLYADTGRSKQTALRVALFGPVTGQYPITLLQRHADAKIVVTRDTASHPIAEHPEWVLS